MKRRYLSHFLEPDTPFYGGDNSFQVEQLRSMSAGDTCNACRWSFPNHAGTHIDLPRHFVSDGSYLDDFHPDYWVFQHVAIVELQDINPGSGISINMLERLDLLPSTELLLLKTGFGRFRKTQTYWMENPIFEPELADYMRGRFSDLRAIGFDTISISSWKDRMVGRKAHRAFLGGDKPILLIEDMDLSQINESTILTRVTVAPLLVRGADASPCTIIAEEGNQ